eukprot:scaffold223918_cov20-Tisochrysis_lutea.AAC.2
MSYQRLKVTLELLHLSRLQAFFAGMQSTRRLGPCLLRCTMQAAGASRPEGAWLSSTLSSLSVSEPSSSHQQTQGNYGGFQQHQRGISTSTPALEPQQQLGSAFSLVLDSLGARLKVLSIAVHDAKVQGCT